MDGRTLCGTYQRSLDGLYINITLQGNIAPLLEGDKTVWPGLCLEVRFLAQLYQTRSLIRDSVLSRTLLSECATPISPLASLLASMQLLRTSRPSHMVACKADRSRQSSAGTAV